MKHNLDTVKQKLYDKDHKLTPQRRVILEVFTKSKEKHLSAEDVWGMVKKTYPEVGLATVYRTLDLFAELDVLHKMDFGDGRGRYEFCESEVHQHHHLICLNCGSVTEFEDDLLECLESEIEKKNHFKILNHELKFYGHCNKCH